MILNILFIQSELKMAKKGDRIVVAMVCTEDKSTNYHTTVNKKTTGKLEVKKYNPNLRKRTVHVSKDKLK